MKRNFTLLIIVILFGVYSASAQNLLIDNVNDASGITNGFEGTGLWWLAHASTDLTITIDDTEGKTAAPALKVVSADCATTRTTGQTKNLTTGAKNAPTNISHIKDIVAGTYTISFYVKVTGGVPSGITFAFFPQTDNVTSACTVSLSEVVADGTWQLVSNTFTIASDYTTTARFGLRISGGAYPDASGTTSTMYIDDLDLRVAGTTDVVSLSSQDIKIYPNPATDIVTIEAPANSVVEICNVAGSTVKSFVSTGSDAKIAVDDLAAGLYIVKTELNGAVVTEKLLIK